MDRKEIFIKNNLEDLKEVVVFGVGSWGIVTLYFLKEAGVRVVECFDNDSNKHGKWILEEYKCQKPYLVKNASVIITVRDECIAEEIKRQCQEIGYEYFIQINYSEMEEAVKELPDKEYLSLRYAIAYGGKTFDWENPKTFNEKLQWLKLYNRNPQYTMLVDKYAVKEYMAQVLGKEYIIPTLGVWETVDDIEWERLPEQFVLKCTHDSGSVIVCMDKAHFDYETAKEVLNTALKNEFYHHAREWVYKDIKPRVIAEEYIVDRVDNELRDYKFYCFDGHVEALLLATNRQSKTEPLYFDYFDGDFNHLEWQNHWHPQAKEVPHKPIKFEEMKQIAMSLSKGFPHVRVDLYEANGNIYFGELTFFDQGGFLRIHPDDWEMIFGNLIKLPEEIIV